jgi:hypothetical protein
MVLSNAPATAALKPADILPSFVCATGVSGQPGFVQPQLAFAYSITTGLLPTFLKTKS